MTKRQLQCELAKRNFWEYLKIRDPEFYKESRPHLKELAEVLQKFSEKKLINEFGNVVRILILNLPPRVGKSYTLTNFCAWVLGKSWCGNGKRHKIITISYNDDMATDFSKYTRDSIMQQASSPEEIVYADIFQRKNGFGAIEKCMVQKGDGGAKKWALAGEFFSYLGAGFGGQVTGKGATIGIIDDPVKNREEAYNDTTLAKIWSFYKNTFRSRIESGGLQIINQTRWRSEDLAGRLMTSRPESCYVYKRSIMENEIRKTIPVLDNKGNMVSSREITVGGDLLCEELCNLEDFMDLQEAIDEDIWRANYFQEPLDMQGALYSSFKTYDIAPEGGKVCAYIDTADTGSDYLVCIVYLECAGEAYVLDVLYTTASMEVTEKKVAKMLDDHKVTICKVESNSGGRGFMRSVRKILQNDHYNFTTVLTGFTQHKNKISRILSASTWVCNNMYFPVGWEKFWGLFHKALRTYMKEGNNKHDDAPDAVTGVAEQFNPKGGIPIFNPSTRKENQLAYTRWQ